MRNHLRCPTDPRGDGIDDDDDDDDDDDLLEHTRLMRLLAATR